MICDSEWVWARVRGGGDSWVIDEEQEGFRKKEKLCGPDSYNKKDGRGE